MNYLTQTNGNCWSLCVACILNMTEAQVPDFNDPELLAEEEFEDWLAAARAWLAERGLQVLKLEAEGEVDNLPAVLAGMGLSGVRWVAGGQPACCDAPGTDAHAVVYLGVIPEWDPHPARMGLSRVERAFVLVPFNAKAVKRP